jgi:hypothetical protein
MLTNKGLIVVALAVLSGSAAAVAQPEAPKNTSAEQRAIKDREGDAPFVNATTEDGTLGTVEWSAFAAGSVGLTAGETLRLSIVNLSASDARVQCGIWQNPEPLSLGDAARCCLPHTNHKLGPGEALDCDLAGSALPTTTFDKAGRVQVRAVVRGSSRLIGANLEVFDTKTGRTSVLLPLHEMAHRN